MTLPSSFLFVLPQAVYADVVDYDERRTGVRREGIYAGAQSLINKVIFPSSSIESAKIIIIIIIVIIIIIIINLFNKKGCAAVAGALITYILSLGNSREVFFFF